LYLKDSNLKGGYKLCVSILVPAVLATYVNRYYSIAVTASVVRIYLLWPSLQAGPFYSHFYQSAESIFTSGADALSPK